MAFPRHLHNLFYCAVHQGSVISIQLLKSKIRKIKEQHFYFQMNSSLCPVLTDLSSLNLEYSDDDDAISLATLQYDRFQI